MSSDRILVTGAAGFIGSHLVDRLLAMGADVLGIDDFNNYYEPRLKRANLAGAMKSSRFTLQELDICDGDAVMAAFEAFRPGVVVHLAARAGVRPSLENPALYHRVNVLGFQHVLDACRAVAPSHAVCASSSSVYGGLKQAPLTEDLDVSRPISPYAASKRMNELMGHVYHHVHGLRLTFLRFFTAYGPRQRPDMAIAKFARLAEAGRPIPMYGDGGSRRDYTYIDDIVQGLVRAIERPLDYEIINLGEQRTTSLAELIAMMERQLGRPIVRDMLPTQPGDVETTFADISKARRLLGYAPSVAIEDGLARYFEWRRAAAEVLSPVPAAASR